MICQQSLSKGPCALCLHLPWTLACKTKHILINDETKYYLKWIYFKYPNKLYGDEQSKVLFC